MDYVYLSEGWNAIPDTDADTERHALSNLDVRCQAACLAEPSNDVFEFGISKTVSDKKDGVEI